MKLDARELSPTNRYLRLRRLESLRAVLRAHNYDVGPEKIAEDMIEAAVAKPRRERNHQH